MVVVKVVTEVTEVMVTKKKLVTEVTVINQTQVIHMVVKVVMGIMVKEVMEVMVKVKKITIPRNKRVLT